MAWLASKLYKLCFDRETKCANDEKQRQEYCAKITILGDNLTPILSLTCPPLEIALAN